jgi:uncharacterized RDD family membrane protein YckC
MSEPLTKAETKEIVTPYAFAVSPELLGKPLATPTRRGIAIIIDVFLIGVLSTISTLIFAAFVALTFFRADAKLKQRAKAKEKGALPYTRLILRGSGAVLIFFVAFMVVKGFEDSNNTSNDSNDEAMTSEAGVKIAELVMILACQDNLVCIQDTGKGMASALATTDISDEEFAQEMTNVLADTSLNETDTASSLLLFQDEFSKERAIISTNSVENTEQEVAELIENEVIESSPQNINPEQTPSIILWAKGLMSDLGIGLGWAALYFSVFTAWANGQTIGKKMCSIKVVRLDGKTPTLWESFERYGGYGAGFATGLLGFLQMYWDPNRQGIHDKISETLVLRINKNAKQVKPQTGTHIQELSEPEASSNQPKIDANL